MSTDNAAMEKLAIVPIEGDNTDPIYTMYNPKELSFTKSVGWTDDSVGCGTDFPAIYFTAGKAITLSVELFFDYYEKGGDVRGVVNQLIHLCEIQPVNGKEKRPPQVKLVWGAGSPIGSKDFLCVVEQVVPKYTMFLSNGTPCRASVTVNLKQADVIGTQTNKDGSRTYGNLINISVQQAVSIPGMPEAITAAGGKIEDKSTWPDSITLQGGGGGGDEKFVNNVNVSINNSNENINSIQNQIDMQQSQIQQQGQEQWQNTEVLSSGGVVGDYGYGYGAPYAVPVIPVVPVVPVVPVAPLPPPPKGHDNEDWQYGSGKGKVD
ncbi:MAG: hypothetical protein IJ268_04100 [Proteobacteria bacterium]|nr:hypothetical protein [Pseudomonadota bacterium]